MRGAAIARKPKGRSGRQGPGGDFKVARVEVVAQAAEKGETVRVDPERDHRTAWVRVVDDLAELRPGQQGRGQVLAARLGDGLNHRGTQVAAEARGADRLQA